MAEPLHIGIDARELSGRPTGVGRLLEKVLEVWRGDPAAAHHRITLFAPDAAAGGTWWEQTQLPRLASRAGVDVLFSPGYTAPLRLSCPSVVAIHDVSFFAHPEWFRWREGLRRRWMTRAAARRARTIVTISQFSAGEIERYLEVPASRIQVIYLGAPPIRAHAHDAAPPVILFVGSLFNRRHIDTLIAALPHVRAQVPDATLVLVGDNRTTPRLDPRALAAAHGVVHAVRWEEYVADDELERLYAGARVFIFLSEYEGFALTPLEALAHGVPSVLLDTPVAREIYGDAARYVEADARQVGSALALLLTDAGERARLVANGQPLFGRYDWRRAASELLATLEQAAASR